MSIANDGEVEDLGSAETTPAQWFECHDHKGWLSEDVLGVTRGWRASGC